MTTLLEALAPVLQPLAPGGAWYALNQATEAAKLDGSGQVKPYIVYLDVVAADNVGLGGPSGLQSSRIQVDIFGPRAVEVQAIRRAVDAALQSSFNTVPISSQGLFEDGVRLFRVIRDFSIWYDESTS